MNIKAVMVETSEKLNQNLKNCIDENEMEYSKSMLYLDVMQELKKIVSSMECSKMLDEITYDLLTSMYFVSFGLYRNAFISLRSALELGLAFIYFVDRNYQYLLWKENLYDIKWCDLSDADNGVLSEKYLKLFYSTEYKEFIESVKNKYRECSEYVHGKFAYMQTVEKASIKYDQTKFDEWNNMFNGVIESLIVLLSIRFNTQVLKIEEDNLITLKDILIKYSLKEVINIDE